MVEAAGVGTVDPPAFHNEFNWLNFDGATGVPPALKNCF